MSEPIVVTVSRAEVEGLDCAKWKSTDLCSEAYVRSKLDFAGIPLTQFGIYPKHGVLNVTVDHESYHITYRWWPNDVRAGTGG